MYYNDAPTVVRDIFTGQASLTVYGFTALFTATTYLLGGIAREQVCTYMCPWPRFQAAMFDEDTLVVTYEAWRGEPRGSHKKGDSWEGRGDCVACNQCVAVCPTGIDIRDGSQLECIGCGLCVDACNTVMARVDRPGWLITFDTQHNQDARAAGQPTTYRLLRPRTILYSLLFATIGVALLWGLALRTTLDLNVLHDRNPLFVTLSDGAIRNGYTLKLLDKTRIGRQLALTVEGLSEPILAGVGNEAEGGDTLFLQSKADDVAGHRVYVRVARDTLTGASTPIRFVVTDLLSGETATQDTVFRGPER
jgi:cytochrome c oxidase accessory protein FixG